MPHPKLCAYMNRGSFLLACLNNTSTSLWNSSIVPLALGYPDCLKFSPRQIKSIPEAS